MGTSSNVDRKKLLVVIDQCSHNVDISHNVLNNVLRTLIQH